MSFENKVVLITGGSSGIGASAAIEFAKQKANVIIVARNVEKLQKVADKCGEVGSKAHTITADISKEDDVKNVVEETIKKFGKLDVLVNNAGISKFSGILGKDILQAYDATMNTNMRAIIQLTNLFAPYLIETKGNIVNVSSVGSKRIPDSPLHLSYCISKAALDHFTKCIAAELAPKGVRVNVVNPGPVKTDIAENNGYVGPLAEVFWQKMKEATSLNRISDPEEIAELILYLASDKAKGITGTSVVTDNGMVLLGRTSS